VDTIKVKPWGKDQGDYVVINASDFDPEKHELLDEGSVGKQMTVAQIKAALAEKNIAIPDGVTLKADLQALLDGAAAGTEGV
jgi:hypothetical protein